MGQLIIGEYSYGEPIRRGSGNNVTIGKFCQIAQNVRIDGGFQHNTKFISTYPFNQRFIECEHLTGHPLIKGDVVIGNDVWIGEDVVIMSGVTIGDGAIIGMGAIISKNVEPYSIVVGAPQFVLRKRYSNEYIKLLLELAWWDKPIAEIKKEIAPLLMGDDIESLLNKYKLYTLPF